MSRQSNRAKLRGAKTREIQKQMLKIGEPMQSQKLLEYINKMTEEEKSALNDLSFEQRLSWLKEVLEKL